MPGVFTPLIMTPALVTFTSSLATIPGSAQVSISRGQYSKFPVPWESVSADPGIEIKVTNNSASAPIAPILMDQWVSPADGVTYYGTFVELDTVQPGDTSTGSGENGGELVAGLPVTQMLLVLMYLGISTLESKSGFTANVQAWAI